MVRKIVKTPGTSTSRPIPGARLNARLGLPEVYEAFGVRFALRMSDAALAQTGVVERLGEYLPCETVRTRDIGHTITPPVCFAVRQRPDGSAWRLLQDGRVLLERRGLEPVLHCLRGTLVTYIGRMAPERVFVHAGAVGWKGRAIVLPGNSFAGKTTLVAELVKAGAVYYSDEVAALDAEGRVHPYARALQMRKPGSPDQRTMPVQELAGVAGQGPLPVGLVVFSQFDAKRAWIVQPLSPGLAVMEGMLHTFPVRVAPQRVMQAWGRVMESALSWKWTRGDAAEAAQTLLQVLESGNVPG